MFVYIRKVKLDCKIGYSLYRDYKIGLIENQNIIHKTVFLDKRLGHPHHLMLDLHNYLIKHVAGV